MKHLLPLSLILLALASCQKADLATLQEQQQEQKQRKQVQFVMAGITEEYSTRATIQSVGCTDLWVWEDTTLLVHTTSADADFVTPTIPLAYGAHNLTFLASNSLNQSFSHGKWTCTKVDAVFAKAMTVTVSSNSSNSRQVQLQRRNSKITFSSTDNLPSLISKCHVIVETRLSLDSQLAGRDSTSRDVTVDVTAKRGQALSVFVNTLTSSLAEEDSCHASIEFLDSRDSVVYSYSRILAVKPNRSVTLKGIYFSGSTNSISIASTDWDAVTVPLFSE